MNKTKTTLQNFFCVNFSQLPKFMLDRILQNWAWNFNHRNFNVLAQNRRWNFTKTVSQIILIFFSRSLTHHRFFRVRIFAICSFFIYHFFCILNFDVILFFTFSQHIKLLKSKISEFFTHIINFWERFQPS